jgi:hypothetical protein
MSIFDRAKDAASELREKATGRSGNKPQTEGKGEEMGERARDKAHGMGDKAREMGKRAKETMDEKRPDS